MSLLSHLVALLLSFITAANSMSPSASASPFPSWLPRPLVDAATGFVQNRLRGDFLWCGVHDVAPFPDAVSAVYPNLDDCCRIHDRCPVIIGRGECGVDGVCNESLLFPVLACDCELRFKSCLEVRN